MISCIMNKSYQPNNSSGAAYGGDPHHVRSRSPVFWRFAKPKSECFLFQFPRENQPMIFTLLFLSSKMFSTFRSRCTIPGTRFLGHHLNIHTFLMKVLQSSCDLSEYASRFVLGCSTSFCQHLWKKTW